MFENLGGFEIVALILLALFIIGPERLPRVLSDTMGFLRKMRSMARNATSDLSRELGTDIELEDLHPKTFLRKHLLSEAEEEALRKPFQDAYHEVKKTTDAMNFNKSDDGNDDVTTGAVDTTRATSGATIGSDTAVGTAKPARRFDDAT